MKGTPAKLTATLQPTGDTTKTNVNLSVNGKIVKLTWSLKTDTSKINSLSGLISDKLWTGNGYHIYQPVSGLILEEYETFHAYVWTSSVRI